MFSQFVFVLRIRIKQVRGLMWTHGTPRWDERQFRAYTTGCHDAKRSLCDAATDGAKMPGANRRAPQGERYHPSVTLTRSFELLCLPDLVLNNLF